MMFNKFSAGLAVALLATLTAISPAASAATPEARSFTGDLEILIEDFPDLELSRTLFFLRSGNNRYRLEFGDLSPDHLRTGMSVTVAGALHEKTILVGPGGPVLSSTENSTAATDGAAVVLRVGFQDAAVSCTGQTITNIMWDGTFSIDSLYQDTSFGAVSFPRDTDNDGQADIFDVTISADIDDPCNPDVWAVDADSEATAAGIDLSSYKHRVYVLPVTTCSWAGRANVGCGTFCRSWIDTCSLPDVYAHELGHNLSMRHASTDTDNDGVVNSNYGDVSDFMGSGGYGWRQVNGPHVLEMGWLPSSQVIDANHQGTQNFVISPLDTDPASAAYPQLIRIPRPGDGDDIFLSYRRRLGHDAGLRTEYVDKTSVHSHDDPGTATMFIKALDDGQQFDDPSIGLSVVQLSHDDLSATLQVSLPVIGCGADADGDGVCDVDDACPLDPENDADADGVCGDLDCDSSNPGAFATPAVVVGVLAESISGGHRFSWIEQASTAGSNTSYDVYSGSLSSMPSLAGDFSQGSCDLENTTSPTFDHLGLDPTTGETFYFLVRAQNGCPGGTGTFGDLQRDATAASSASVCPE